MCFRQTLRVFIFVFWLVIFRLNLAHKMADRFQPVHRTDAPKFSVYKRMYANFSLY